VIMLGDSATFMRFFSFALMTLGMAFGAEGRFAVPAKMK
jgi:hypothetical protein